MQYVRTYKIHTDTKFHVHSSNGSLAIAIKPEGTEHFLVVVTLLLSILEKHYLHKLHISLRSIPVHNSMMQSRWL
jgi:hypothetical protein